MQQTCPTCEHLLRDDDEVVATVVARYKLLGSNRVYSISRPTECLDLRHRNCQHRQGIPEGD